MGTTVITPWNVGQIPAEDLAILDDWVRYEKDLGKIYDGS
jgi:hypothetical protein